MTDMDKTTNTAASAPLQPGDRVLGPGGLEGEVREIIGCQVDVDFGDPFIVNATVRLDALTRIDPPATVWRINQLSDDDRILLRGDKPELTYVVGRFRAKQDQPEQFPIAAVSRVTGRAELNPDGTIVPPEPPWTQGEVCAEADAALDDYGLKYAPDESRAYLRGHEAAWSRVVAEYERFAREGR